MSPALDATNTSEAAMLQKMANGWVFNGWFGEGLIFQSSFVPVGSTINLTYHVTDKDGKSLVGQDVKLRINKAYSVANTILQVDDVLTRGIDSPPFDQANVIHKTDAYGNVTFAVKNLDREPAGEPQPDSWISAPKINADGLNDLHSQMMPEVAGEKLDHSVMSEFHYYIPTNQVVPAVTRPTIRLVSPSFTDANSFQRTDIEKVFVDNAWRPKGTTVRQAYIPVGSAINLVYKVTNDYGVAWPNQRIKLHVNGAYSLSNAQLTDGKIATDSKKDTSLGMDQAVIEGVSDAYGFVVFSLQNTDKIGEISAATSAEQVNKDLSKGALYSWIFPEKSGIDTDVVDIVEFHFFGENQSQLSSTNLNTDNSTKIEPPNNSEILVQKYCIPSGDCPLGSIGPGGGIVFYDAGLQQSWGRYLEFAPRGWSGSDFYPSAPWCNLNDLEITSLLNASVSSEIGQGKSNTTRIRATCGSSAALLASQYQGGGMNDWFLPSEEELIQVSNFTSTLLEKDPFEESEYYFWTSSASYWPDSDTDNENAVTILFLDGQRFNDPKDSEYCVLPVRSFS